MDEEMKKYLITRHENAIKEHKKAIVWNENGIKHFEKLIADLKKAKTTLPSNAAAAAAPGAMF